MREPNSHRDARSADEGDGSVLLLNRRSLCAVPSRRSYATRSGRSEIPALPHPTYCIRLAPPWRGHHSGRKLTCSTHCQDQQSREWTEFWTQAHGVDYAKLLIQSQP
jgi:hypothetical protein